MGICSGKFKSYSKEEKTLLSVVSAIESDSLSKMRSILDKNPDLNIDIPIASLSSHKVSILTYALSLELTDIFIYLVSERRANLQVLSEELLYYGLTPLTVMCQMSLLELLEFYIPIHLSLPPAVCSVHSSEYSLFNENKTNTSPLLSPQVLPLPIHKACESGKFATIKFLVGYFVDKQPPDELNIHFINERTGDNAALASLRSGNLQLIRYLHEVTKADFLLINKRKENAIIVASAGSKNKPEGSYIDIFKYLIDVVKVDILYEYEEALLIMNDLLLISFFEERLQSKGVNVLKSSVDRRNCLVPHNVPSVSERNIEARLGVYKDTKFSFKDIFKKELEESYISSIPYNVSYPESVLNSMFVNE